MRFHVAALPGQPTIRENSSCAYTQKVRRFCQMMKEAGHEVFLYGGQEGNDAPSTVYVAAYPKMEPPPFDPAAWRTLNLRVAAEVSERAEPGDFLCLIAGRCQESLAEALPELQAVEFGIGYGGVFAPFKVFESYAWMHAVYGAMADTKDAGALDGRAYDAVIPNYFDLDDFPLDEDKQDYLLYCGRLVDRKGVGVAAEVARRLEMDLLLAGDGPHVPDYGRHVGSVGPDERAALMGGARALLAPTQYLEPFGGVVVEAQLCGTPAITTDWGAFPETVQQGVTGWRCRTVGEFVWAVENTERLASSAEIHERAAARYSLEAVQPLYERYFNQLQTLGEEGFYSSWEGLSGIPESRIGLEA